MSDDFIPYGSQWLDEADIDAVVEVMRGDWLTTGPAVDAFEEALADAGGADHAVAVNSGTAALHAAYEAAGVGPDTEVIVPSLTFSATANAARYLGATVRFADVDKQTLTMSPESVREQVNERTRVIAPVDFAGHSADIHAIREVSGDAVIVQDAAHSIGGAYRGQPIGSVADMTCFSFHPVKTVTSGEGGAVLTDNDEWAERIRQFRSHGIIRGVERLSADEDPGGWAYDIEELGYNYRITDIQCALGLSQLRKLARFVERRQEIAAHYRELLVDLNGVELPPEADWCSHAYHLFAVRVPAKHRKAIFKELRSRGIGVQVHYIPVNMLSVYRDLGYEPEGTPRTLNTYRRMISLPCFPKLKDEDIMRVAGELKQIVTPIA
jgi:UDP-4-amino-4,6-dideoxy-N-acetyl-beta-L-altrosamine transaminase